MYSSKHCNNVKFVRYVINREDAALLKEKDKLNKNKWQWRDLIPVIKVEISSVRF